MCGIVGLFLKNADLAPALGKLLSDMLITMTDRGPDSAGIAVYGAYHAGSRKVTLQSAQPDQDFTDLPRDLSEKTGIACELDIRSTHSVLRFDAGHEDTLLAALADLRPNVRVMSLGDQVEIYKEVGVPESVVNRFGIPQMSGTHGIGHTRMATESAVTTLGAHPFSTGNDQCLVHNGSLSNHNRLRRKLVREGMTIATLNDTEVAAAYLSQKMQTGASLGQALEASIDDLDGFYTFVVGTKTGFGVLRDPIACKPAVLAETENYVAFGSEYRALVGLPDIEAAEVWEPEPATVYFWEH